MTNKMPRRDALKLAAGGASMATFLGMPAILRAALDGIREATNWAAANRDSLARIMSEATGVDLEAQQRTVDRLTVELTPVTDTIVQSQQGIADTFLKLGIVPRAITVREAVWTASQS